MSGPEHRRQRSFASGVLVGAGAVALFGAGVFAGKVFFADRGGAGRGGAAQPHASRPDATDGRRPATPRHDGRRVMTHDRDHSAAAASKRYRALIDEFCRADYTPEQLLQRIAPRAVKAGGRPLPPGTQYYIENDVVTTVYLDDPLVQVVWWRRPEEGATEVGELHIVPQLKVVEYKAFVAEHGLGAGKALPQGHALANIPHEHAYRCGARALVLTVEEIVWKGEVVGKIGGIGMRKTARPPAGSERR